jgi:hypothetical protein
VAPPFADAQVQAAINLDAENNYSLLSNDRDVAGGRADAGRKRRREPGEKLSLGVSGTSRKASKAGPEASSGGGVSVGVGRPARGLKRPALVVVLVPAASSRGEARPR